MGGPVGIVFQTFHPRGDAILVPAEVDDSQGTLVPPSAMADGDAALVVAAPGALLLLRERTPRLALVQPGGDDPESRTAVPGKSVWP